MVNHFNGLTPSGAEGAVDRCLGGAISRRAARGEMDGRFGATTFLPAVSALLAAEAILVLGLGEPEKFAPDRLPELGAALVEAVAALGIKDVATVVHGAGTTTVDAETATRLFLTGVREALATVPGADCLRELTIVERDPDKVPAIRRGLPVGGLAVRPAPSQSPAAPVDGDVVPWHLRIGITRAGSGLKVTVIGHGSFDVAGECPYPADEATRVFRTLRDEVLHAGEASQRAEALASIGHQLAETFLRAPELNLPGLAEQLKERAGGYVIVRLDRWTVDLPWEIAFLDGGFLSRTHLLSRQLEINSPGRPAPPAPTGETLNVLVVGDPIGDLPAARQEAEAVTERLRALPHVAVTSLVHGVSYADVSRELDTTRYDVLHYAGHARFDAAGHGRGGFALADELLTAEDLSTRRYLPRVVFANACQSARTQDFAPARAEANPFAGGTQTIDLVTGLLRAGVRAFVGSMWDVDDAAARTFAGTFYTGLREGASIGAVVARAREAVITSHGPGQPAWAGYALYGSPWLRLL
ncbi:CHAT domain-containing protein [Phytohabitans rumicis]|uniref:CHAT domain-containing protein n=1 Tax=Phytohabitans rumicis TaxID=1076125 RepID=A0A6V8LER9_9ACTN|nr:CHAT domain-containing protein [Phytohabitans rumicis]GFJ94160.1 hypothetical protein Prum_078020 [Phytohabitans rumicis]